MEDHTLPRKLAAILIADAVGFSRQMGEDEEHALRVLDVRRALIRQAVIKHHGRVFGGAGDSVIAEFPSAVNALKSAVEMQAGIAALNDAPPENERMQFRVGINLGDVIVDRRNLFGDGVNVAERLQTLANPGGICISANVHEQVQGKLQLFYTDLGSQNLKNIARPVKAFLVGAVEDDTKTIRLRGTGWPRLWKALALATLLAGPIVVGIALYTFPGMIAEDSSALLAGPPTVAVLPFANLSNDPKQDYFSDGVTEDIIASLSRFSNLSVLAGSATARFKSSGADSPDLRQKLGARYVVVGSVRRSGNQVRVSADLTDTEKNLHLWTRQFDAEMSDIFAVQDEITRNIVGALAIKLSRIEQERAFIRDTVDLNAYDYYLRGRARLAIGERADNLEARAMFEKAIAIDPHYSIAVAKLGETYLSEVTGGWTEFVSDAMMRAETLGRQALSVEPELAEGHQLLAGVYLGRADYDRAILEARQAVEINPSDAYGYATLGNALMLNGDAEGAIAAIEKAKTFDPTLQWDYVSALGFAYYLSGRYDDTIAVIEPIAGKGSSYSLYAILAAAYAQLGRVTDAEGAAKEARRLWPFFTVERYIQQWRDQESRELVAEGLAKAGLK